MIHPLCLLRSLWRNLKLMAPISGHDYVEAQDGQPKCVLILRCETCGHHSIAWEACARCSPRVAP